MGKVGKTFTLDLKVLAWLEQHAEKHKKSESYIVNALLNSAKRRTETWTCSECNGTNHVRDKVCWASTECKGVKA
jgi:hypothetical protein